MNDDLSRRIWVYGTMGFIIIILLYISVTSYDKGVGEKIETKNTFFIEELKVVITSQNLLNNKTNLIKINDPFQYNVTYFNNYDNTIVIYHYPKVLLGDNLIFNGSQHQFTIGSGFNGTINPRISLDGAGLNYVIHNFEIHTFEDGKEKIQKSSYTFSYWVLSQDNYITVLIHYEIIRWIWALAIPVVIISVKHVAEIWYGREYKTKKHEEIQDAQQSKWHKQPI